MKDLMQFLHREIEEFEASYYSRDYLQNITEPRLVRYYEGKYAINECWLITKVSQTDFFLCVVEGELKGVRYWGLVEKKKNQFHWASYGVSTLAGIIDELENGL